MLKRVRAEAAQADLEVSATTCLRLSWLSSGATINLWCVSLKFYQMRWLVRAEDDDASSGSAGLGVVHLCQPLTCKPLAVVWNAVHDSLVEARRDAIDNGDHASAEDIDICVQGYVLRYDLGCMDSASIVDCLHGVTFKACGCKCGFGS